MGYIWEGSLFISSVQVKNKFLSCRKHVQLLQYLPQETFQALKTIFQMCSTGIESVSQMCNTKTAGLKNTCVEQTRKVFQWLGELGDAVPSFLAKQLMRGYCKVTGCDISDSR